MYCTMPNSVYFVCCADWKMLFSLWNCSHLCQLVSVELANMCQSMYQTPKGFIRTQHSMSDLLHCGFLWSMVQWEISNTYAMMMSHTLRMHMRQYEHASSAWSFLKLLDQHCLRLLSIQVYQQQSFCNLPVAKKRRLSLTLNKNYF